jgi:hypothetical protein
VIPTFTPRERLSWLIGGRFPRGKSNDGWWPSKTQQQSDQSMSEILSTLHAKVFQWFIKTETVLGLAAELRACGDTPNAHVHFEIGCCQLRVSNRLEAKTAIVRARTLYHKTHDQMPTCVWPLDWVTQCNRLLAAIDDKTDASVLNTWRDETVSKLMLDKLIGQLNQC